MVFSQTLKDEAINAKVSSSSLNIEHSSKTSEISTTDYSKSTDLNLESELVMKNLDDQNSVKTERTTEGNLHASEEKSMGIIKNHSIPFVEATRHSLKSIKETECNAPKVRKRKWISRKETEAFFPILSISTDSLKTIISNVEPVPLSDIKLDSSSEIEEICNEGEQGEEISKNISTSTDEKNFAQPNVHVETTKHFKELSTAENCFSSPSPSKNEESNILYITNLVRPFTILQLKSLLARTGKMKTDGFWIDRIKSKCYVQYETEDEAIETRHALHGIRWPASNPKCLNVDFAKYEDMQKVVMSTKDDTKKIINEGPENSCNSGYNKDEKKSKPIREWDVGKNGSQGANKGISEKGRNRECKDIVENSEDVLYRGKTQRGKTQTNSNSSSARKQIKEADSPPLRLLDDLFRKTRTTPCIYWLPLTPEQITERGLLRKKHNEEQQRIHQRDTENVKMYDRAGIREKHQKIEDSSDRCKSRSRDKRRN